MNLVEKIFAKHANKSSVKAGDLITVDVDYCMANDATMRLNVDIVENKLKAISLHNPSKVVIIMDHQVPADSPQTAEVHEMSKQFCKKYNIDKFHASDGICHQLMVESYVLPGQLVVGADSHSPSYGALGALGCGMGSTDICAAMVTGKTWVKVPQTVRVILKGKLKESVYPKDIILNLIKKTGAGGMVYKAVEFQGEAVKAFSVSERFTLCNMTTEAGAKTAVIVPDQQVYDYLKKQRNIAIEPESWWCSDKDAEYESTIAIDLDSLVPQIACPHSVDNVYPVKEVEGTRIDQAFLGACTNARIDDLRIAAEVLKGKKIHPDVKLHVAPASRDVQRQAMREGIMEILLDAGAVLNHTGCSTCWGAHQGVLGNGQVLISSQNRNFRGRSGSKDALIYLASPKTVAVSALKGVITDPRNYNN